mgnify:CR=1 FL=1
MCPKEALLAVPPDLRFMAQRLVLFPDSVGYLC